MHYYDMEVVVLDASNIRQSHILHAHQVPRVGELLFIDNEQYIINRVIWKNNNANFIRPQLEVTRIA